MLFSNSKHIALQNIHHTIPAHQDWASMQGSINSVVIWIPLIDIDQDLGALQYVPGSHKEGLLSKNLVNSFGFVDKYTDEDFISQDFKIGGIFVFSSFLVHRSGNNITDNIRWSCHFRYNDLQDVNFKNRGFPHAYIYKPIDHYLDTNLNTKQLLYNYYDQNIQ